MPRRFVVSSVAAAGLAAAVLAVPPGPPPKPADNPGADQAAKAAQVAGGLTAAVWAAEPLLANPVSFAFDGRGRCYVAESDRAGTAVGDIRGHMDWVADDLANRTVADLLAMYARRGHRPDPAKADQLRLVWDADGDGTADKSTVFSGGYNRPQDGIAAGVLAHRGDVFFACIPALYRLRDTTGDGVADVKQVLSEGYGVRLQFYGHDLHGLTAGPDGKIYFSCGDRGFTAVGGDGTTVANPDSGAVLRCDPDGSHLELVHTGLRNPQELAFDDHGNLFTWDNNSDSGDRARWVQVVPGGDSGWRAGYQYGTRMHPPGVPQGNRGPWNAEKLWHTAAADRPAYAVPPLAHLGDGPSGIAAYPGVGLADKYKGHFFAVDFRGSPGNSVIWALKAEPNGASFRVSEPEAFVRNALPTDCAFGPDGAFYWLDWVEGWGPTQKGRVFRVADQQALKHPAVAEAKRLLAAGLAGKSHGDLATLLAHPHRHVRYEAQFELAARPPGDAVPALEAVAVGAADPLARLHAVWGLGMVGRTVPEAVAVVRKLADDPDPVIRAAVARAPNVGPDVLTPLVADADPRVRFAAAAHLDPVGPAGLRAVLGMIRDAADADPYLRHAGAVALSRAGAIPADVRKEFDCAAVRRAVVVALRKNRSPELADYLTDADPSVAAEAARAVYDERVADALPALAALADRPKLPDPIAYRAVAAGFRLGTPDDAGRLARFAARSDEPAHLRAFALELLADWPAPPRRDPITGLVVGPDLAARPVADAAAALAAVLPAVFAGPDAVVGEAVKAAARLGLPAAGPPLAAVVADDKRSAGVRADALAALDALKAGELSAAAAAALGSAEPKLRGAARDVLAKADPVAAARELPRLVADPNVPPAERQAAVAVLGRLPESPAADAALAGWLDAVVAGTLPADLVLDVKEAAKARAEAAGLKLHAPLSDKLTAVDERAKAAAAADPLAPYRDAVAGGDPDKGKDVFLNNAAVACQRCHKAGGQGGEVGPAVDGVGGQHPADYLLESIVYPNKQIAKGYEAVVLSLADGRTVSGVLRAKDAAGYTVVSADGKVTTVPADDVESARPDRSAMPDDLHPKLTRRQLRDLVAYLASLK